MPVLAKHNPKCHTPWQKLVTFIADNVDRCHLFRMGYRSMVSIEVVDILGGFNLAEVINQNDANVKIPGL